MREALRRMGPAFVLAAVFAVVYVEMLARFGIVSDRTLWGTIREKYGPAARFSVACSAASRHSASRPGTSSVSAWDFRS